MVLVASKPINTIVLAGLIVMGIHFLHAGWKHTTRQGTEEPMTTVELITALFYEVDEQLRTIPKHPEAHLWPSEVVREQGDAGGDFKTPVEWPVLFICHSNPEKPPYACQTATCHV